MGDRTAAPGIGAAQLIAEHMEIVTFQARQLARQLGRYAAEDELVSVGSEALVLAAQSHDPALAPFPPYAMRKVRWAMLDFARRDTHVRASVARRRARAVMALEEVSAAGRGPGDGSTEGDEPLPTEGAQLAALRDALSAHASALFVGLTSSPEPEPASSPESDLMRARATVALRRALDQLPERERALIEGHYFRGERFDEMAESMRISKSRVSRLHTRALVTLGDLLKEHA